MEAISRIIKTTFNTVGQPFLAFGHWLRRKVACLRNVQPQHDTKPDNNNNTVTRVQDRNITLSDNNQPESISESPSDSINDAYNDWDTCADAYSNTQVSQLLSLMDTDSFSLTFCKHLQQLAKKLPPGETQEVIYSACQDVANACLSQDRMLAYKLSIILSHDIAPQHKKSLINVLRKQCSTPNPPLDPGNDDRESTWSRDYHANMHSLSNAIHAMRQSCSEPRYPLTQTLCTLDELSDYFALIAAPADDSDAYDVALTAASYFLDQLDRALVKAEINEERQKWIRKKIYRFKSQFAESARSRLPHIYQHGITNGCIDPDALRLREYATEDWEGVLRDTNGFSAFGTQFFKDCGRDHYILKDETQGTINCYNPGSGALTDNVLKTFCGGNDLVAGTLSKVVNQTFYSYMLKLETARMLKFSPWLILVRSNDEHTTQEYTITMKKNGDIAIRTLLKTDHPACTLDRYNMYLKGAEYSLSCETTFDGEKLKQGILSASEPTVRIEYPATETIQWHDNNGN